MQDWLSAEDAVRLGLANEVVAPEELMTRALVRIYSQSLPSHLVHSFALCDRGYVAIGLQEVATELTTRKGPALSLSKQVMNHHLRKDLDEVLATELEVIMKSVKATGGFDNARL